MKPGTRITWNGKGARITRPHPHVADAYYCIIDGRGMENVVRKGEIKLEALSSVPRLPTRVETR